MIKRYFAETVSEMTDGAFMQYAEHAAFVERVREIAERMDHHEDCSFYVCKCGSEWCEPGFRRNNHYFAYGECNCPRGKLLEVCNG